ncbi:MAG: transglutaminase family protein [Terracidiphilus sp.]
MRRDDPLHLVLELNQRLYHYFDYVPRSTRVDSPIDEAILSGTGVCQDFAHTMIALLRHVRIPTRYVSGYLYRGAGDHDRSRLTQRTPGLRRSCRISAGSASIPPTTSSRIIATSAPR